MYAGQHCFNCLIPIEESFSIALQAFLVLDAPVTQEVTFTCRSEVVNDTAEGLRMAANPPCEGIGVRFPGRGNGTY